MRMGDLYFVKSSEEPVVSLMDSPEEHMLASATIVVRRPIMGADGTRYENAEFYRCELETPEEQDLRKIEDIKRRHRLTQLAAKEAGPAVQFDMFAEADPNAPRN